AAPARARRRRAAVARRGGTTATVIDPSGKMTWKESVAPLDRTLTRFGNSTTPAPVKFSVDQVIVGVDPAEYSAVSDFFAAAQFEELTDAEKLSRASFERRQAGVEVASA